jgi:stalled ribosome rescue protein Dom34
MEMNRYLKTQIGIVVAMIINDKLSSGIITIEFYKADDSVRTMRATTKLSLLPDFKSDNPGEVTAIDMNLVKVFDVEKQEWRSFKIDKLKSVNGIAITDCLVSYFKAGL